MSGGRLEGRLEKPMKEIACLILNRCTVNRCIDMDMDMDVGLYFTRSACVIVRRSIDMAHIYGVGSQFIVLLITFRLIVMKFFFFDTCVCMQSMQTLVLVRIVYMIVCLWVKNINKFSCVLYLWRKDRENSKRERERVRMDENETNSSSLSLCVSVYFDDCVCEREKIRTTTENVVCVCMCSNKCLCVLYMCMRDRVEAGGRRRE